MATKKTPAKASYDSKLAANAWQTKPKFEAHMCFLANAKKARMSIANVKRTDVYQACLDMYNDEQVGVYSERDKIVVGLNVAQSIVDTVTSLFAPVKPRASYQTCGGDWDLRQKAIRHDEWVASLNHKLKLYDLLNDGVRIKAILGTAVYKVTEGDDGPEVESVPPWEVWTPTALSRYGKPRDWYHAKIYDRQTLLDTFLVPFDDGETLMDQGRRRQFEDAVKNAPVPSMQAYRFDTLDDEIDPNTVEVFEGWYTASRDGVENGRHIVAIEGFTIVDEVWTWATPPLVLDHWYPPTPKQGVWGTGVIKRVYDTQVELSYLQNAINVAHHLHGKVKLLVDATSKINENHLKDNRAGIVLKYNGTPPSFLQLQMVAPEMYQEVDKKIARMYQQVGVSERGSAAEQPKGVEAAIAIKRVVAIQSDRLRYQQQRIIRAALDLDEMLLRVARDMQAAGRDITVRVDGSRWKELKFSDVMLDPKDYRVVALPISATAEDPSQRMDDVMSLVQLGIVKDEGQLLSMLELPNIKSFADLKAAPLNYATWCMQGLSDGKAVVCDDKAPSEYVLPIALAGYLNAVVDGAPIKVLLNWSAFIDSVQAAADKRAAEAAAAAKALEPPPMMPPGMPSGPPPDGMPMPPPDIPMPPQGVLS